MKINKENDDKEQKPEPKKDEGVIDIYKGITGVNIEALGKGRYIFKK